MFSHSALFTIVVVGCLTGRISVSSPARAVSSQINETNGGSVQDASSVNGSIKGRLQHGYDSLPVPLHKGEKHEIQCPSCTNVKVNADLGFGLDWLTGIVNNIANTFHDEGCTSVKTDSIEKSETCPIQSGATAMCSFYRGTVNMKATYLFKTVKVNLTVYRHACYQATEALDNCCYDSASIHDSEKKMHDVVNSVSRVAKFFGSGIKYAGNICLRPSNKPFNDCSPANRIGERRYLLVISQLVVVFMLQLSFNLTC